MKTTLKHSILAAAVALYTANSAKAAFFVDVQVLGNTNGGSTYSSSVNVTPGQTVFYEVVEQLAAPGVSNTIKGYTLGTQVSGTDGVNSLSLNLNDADGAILSTPTLVNGWSGANGTSPGSVSGESITGINAAQGAGVFVGATSPSQILTGSFVAGSSATDKFSGSWNFGGAGGGTGGVKVLTTTGSKSLSLGGAPGASEASADPYVGYSPLTLFTGSSSPVLSLTSTTPTGYGSSLGSISVLPGGNGSYTAHALAFSATTSGNVTVNTFSPATDDEIYALDVDGASSAQLQDLLTDISSSGIPGLTDSLSYSGISAGPNVLAGIFTDGGTPLYISVNPGLASSPILGFNLANDPALSGVSISGVAAVPEPVSASILGLGGLFFLARRRRSI